MRAPFRLTGLVAGACAAWAALAPIACRSSGSPTGSASSNVVASDPASAPDPPGDGSPPNWVDCVATLHVVAMRDFGVANSERLADTRPWIEAGARVSDLATADVGAFCDWEACLRTNGYGHLCFVNDAGWEQCRLCDGSADCHGLPTSQDDCVAHAGDPGVAPCHVALLEECLLQRALRLPADPRVTQTCFLSERACAGKLPGDLSAQAVAARHETDQVAVEQAEREFAVALETDADPPAVASFWAQQFCMWDGGLPDDLDGGGDGQAEGENLPWCEIAEAGFTTPSLADADSRD
jgi:hypothetical protein